MLPDHHTRLSVAREHADRLRETMLASKRTRRPDDAAPQEKARIYTFPKARTQTERGAAA